MKVKIEIDTKTFIRFWMVVIGFFLAGLAIWRAKDALILVLISLFLALALNQPVTRIARILPNAKKNRGRATAVAYLIIIVILGLFIRFVVPPVIEQTSKFIDNLPQVIEEASRQYNGLEEFAKSHNVNIQQYTDQVVQSIRDYSSDLTKDLSGVVFGSINAIINGIFTMFVVLVMTFLMLVEGPEWLNKLWALYDDKTKMKKHRKVTSRMYKAVSGFVNGQLLVSAIAGAMGVIVVFILSLFMEVPSNLAIPAGVIITFIDLIPMFGATIAGAITSLIIGINSIPAGIVFLIYFVIYQQIENNIISPMVQAKTNKLSALLVIISLTIGMYALGLLGALISIPAASCGKILFEEYFLERKNEPKSRKKERGPILAKKKQKEA